MYRDIFQVWFTCTTSIRQWSYFCIRKEFQNFLKQNGIHHTLTAPYNPVTNGQAERFVQTLKKSLKTFDTHTVGLDIALQRILTRYRIIPHCTTGISPAELMFNRTIRCSFDIMKPIENTPVQRFSDTSCYIKNSNDFREGKRVSCRNYQKGDKWMFGRITKRIGRLHYIIRLDDGRTWKRHLNQMRMIGERTPLRVPYNIVKDRYVDYNVEDVDTPEPPIQIEAIGRPVDRPIPDLRRSQRVRKVPQRRI